VFVESSMMKLEANRQGAEAKPRFRAGGTVDHSCAALAAKPSKTPSSEALPSGFNTLRSDLASVGSVGPGLVLCYCLTLRRNGNGSAIGLSIGYEATAGAFRHLLLFQGFTAGSSDPSSPRTVFGTSVIDSTGPLGTPFEQELDGGDVQMNITDLRLDSGDSCVVLIDFTDPANPVLRIKRCPRERTIGGARALVDVGVVAPPPDVIEAALNCIGDGTREIPSIAADGRCGHWCASTTSRARTLRPPRGRAGTCASRVLSAPHRSCVIL
jgi:hypothetical protein